MINLEGYSLREKAWIVAREIAKNQNNPFLIKLAKELKTPENVYAWVKSYIRYKKEAGDILYEPEELIKKGAGDCEDLCLLIGSLVRILGYPVKIRIVEDGTRHIYPLVKVGGEWVVFDATPHANVPYINGVPRGYRVVIDGIVTDEGLSGLDSQFEKAMITGAGVAVGSTIAKIALKSIGLSGLLSETVEVGQDYIPKAGDHLLFYFKPKWYIPDRLEEWILKKVVKRKVPNCKVTKAYFKTEEGIKYLIVEVVVGEKNLGAVIATILAITGALLAGGLGTYFVLAKVEKIIEKPQTSIFMKFLPFALIVYGIAKILRG